MSFSTPERTPSINFEVLPFRYSVEVLWDQPLGTNTAHGLYEIMSRHILSLDGVESVSMRRYSATVEFAEHLTDARAVAKAIYDSVFEEGDEFVTQLEVTYPDWFARVEVADA